MDRLNETDWTSVYDGGPWHQEDFRNTIKILRKCSKQAAAYSKVYSDGAKMLRNSNDSYKKTTERLRNDVYAKAEQKYGIDIVCDYNFIIDDNPDHWN